MNFLFISYLLHVNESCLSYKCNCSVGKILFYTNSKSRKQRTAKDGLVQGKANGFIYTELHHTKKRELKIEEIFS